MNQWHDEKRGHPYLWKGRIVTSTWKLPHFFFFFNRGFQFLRAYFITRIPIIDVWRISNSLKAFPDVEFENPPCDGGFEIPTKSNEIETQDSKRSFEILVAGIWNFCERNIALQMQGDKPSHHVQKTQT